MKIVSVSGSPRGNVGKKDARKIRKDGNVPCVIYGGKEQIQFFTSEKSFLDIVFTPEVCYVKITVDGREYETILQEIQYHPVTDKILHADFMELSADKPIVMNIPVKIHGTAPGVLKGGKLVQKARKLKVRGLPKDLPDFIDLSIEKLDIGSSIKVGDITVDKATLLDNKNYVVVTVRVTRAVEEAAAPGAAGAEAQAGA